EVPLALLDTTVHAVIGGSRRRSSLHLRALGGRVPDHPTKSDDFARAPVRALKPASGGPTRRCRAASAAVLLAPPLPWLRPPMPRIRVGSRRRYAVPHAVSRRPRAPVVSARGGGRDRHLRPRRRQRRTPGAGGGRVGVRGGAA